jgi:NADPH-dependent 2,4-dienoyl-CoA reductase/sulfur reductase-like enzyme
MRYDIVIVGGGIAGCEMALTLAQVLPEVTVAMIAERPMLTIRPSLVYVPFGVSETFTEIPLSLLEHDHLHVLVDSVSHVHLSDHRVDLTSGGSVEYGELIMAVGTEPSDTSGMRLRTPDDARALADALAKLRGQGRRHGEIVVRSVPWSPWDPPAIELGFLVERWLQVQRMDWNVAVVTANSQPLEIFGPQVDDKLRLEMALRSISLVEGVPPGRVEMIDGDLAIDIGALSAVHVPGFPQALGNGFLPVDETGRHAQSGAFVIGDAADLTIKGAFALSWQALRIAHALNADAALPEQIDEIPVGQMEYQMDMGDATLHVRMAAPRSVHTDPQVISSHVSSDPPDKLRGLLVRQTLLDHRPSAARRFSISSRQGVQSHESI